MRKWKHFAKIKKDLLEEKKGKRKNYEKLWKEKPLINKNQTQIPPSTSLLSSSLYDRRSTSRSINNKINQV